MNSVQYFANILVKLILLNLFVPYLYFVEKLVWFNKEYLAMQVLASVGEKCRSE